MRDTTLTDEYVFAVDGGLILMYDFLVTQEHFEDFKTTHVVLSEVTAHAPSYPNGNLLMFIYLFSYLFISLFV